MNNEITLKGGGSLRGELLPPGDKSISHRSVILGALAKGRSIFDHFLNSEDCLNTLEAFKKMGIKSQLDGERLSIDGQGLWGLKAPTSDLDMGNSGTSTRLLLGVLAAQPFTSQLFGDASLSKRPMDRVVKLLRLIGADIEGQGERCLLPLKVRGKKLRGRALAVLVPSAQVKSCLLLAGLFAEGETEVMEELPTRDHTERAFKVFGIPLRTTVHPRTTNFYIEKAEEFHSTSYRIPGDISSAAFFIVGALISKGSQIRLKDVGLNPTRIGLLHVLERMKANIRIENKKETAEPTGDLVISSSRLRGTTVDANEIPFLIDEIPILTLAAALAEGETYIVGARELRVKESDRIAVMVKNLRAVGATVDELEDGFRIQGREHLTGGTVESFGDHRVAMTFIVASLVSQGDITVKGFDCIPTSYPAFFDDFNSLRK